MVRLYLSDKARAAYADETIRGVESTSSFRTKTPQTGSIRTLSPKS